MPHPNKEEWLPLKQAAQRLGIHPTTLRRWADSGELPILLTPGGHRRFAAADLDRFAEEHRRLKTITGLERIWAEQALIQTRKEIGDHKNAPWLTAFNEEDRERKRALGRRLMGLMLQYVSLSAGGDDLLDEARAIGREYAANALGLGLPLVEAIQAMLFFRDTMVEAAVQLPEVAHVRPEANTKLLRRINLLLNAVHLAIAETYDKAMSKP